MSIDFPTYHETKTCREQPAIVRREEHQKGPEKRTILNLPHFRNALTNAVRHDISGVIRKTDGKTALGTPQSAKIRQFKSNVLPIFEGNVKVPRRGEARDREGRFDKGTSEDPQNKNNTAKKNHHEEAFNRGKMLRELLENRKKITGSTSVDYLLIPSRLDGFRKKLRDALTSKAYKPNGKTRRTSFLDINDQKIRVEIARRLAKREKKSAAHAMARKNLGEMAEKKWAEIEEEDLRLIEMKREEEEDDSNEEVDTQIPTHGWTDSDLWRFETESGFYDEVEVTNYEKWADEIDAEAERREREELAAWRKALGGEMVTTQ